MRVTVLLFARPREVVGTGRVELDLAEASDAGAAFEALARQAPALGAMRHLLRCAVDGEYAAWETPLRDGMELALIPPTAGG